MHVMNCLLQMQWYYTQIKWLSLRSLGQDSSQTFIRPTKAQVVCVQERDQPSTGQESATISKEYEMSVGVATEMPHLKPNYFQLFQESQKPQRWYMRVILNSSATTSLSLATSWTEIFRTKPKSGSKGLCKALRRIFSSFGRPKDLSTDGFFRILSS